MKFTDEKWKIYYTMVMNLGTIKQILKFGTFLLLFIAGSIFIQKLYFSSFEAEIRYVQVEDGRIAYYLRGEGESLLMLGGSGMTMSDWDPILLRELAEKHQLIIVDFRGVGLSEASVDTLSVEKMTDDLLRVLDDAGIARTDVLGWSMGSILAQEMAILYPERVDRIIMASTFSADNSVIGPSTDVSDWIQNNLQGPWESILPVMFMDTPDGRKELANYLERRRIAIVNKEFPVVPEGRIEVKLAQQKAIAELASGGDRLERLSKITQPTLIIAGQDDRLLPVENDRIVAKVIDHSELMIFPSTGHAFLFQEPGMVAKEISRFLDENK